MLSTTFSIEDNDELKLLLLGAHCDDIEIGCGGTLLKLIEKYENISIKWIVFSSNKIRRKEARLSAEMYLGNVQKKDVRVYDFKDGFLPSVWSDIKEIFETLKHEFTPDVIFTHYRDDLHQDHRTINELTWNTFRNHLILEYEILKYDGDLGNPNFFVPLKSNQIKRKKEIIINSFKSQKSKQWFDDILLNSTMRIRGVECAAESKFAEAFYCRKMVI